MTSLLNAWLTHIRQLGCKINWCCIVGTTSNLGCVDVVQCGLGCLLIVMYIALLVSYDVSWFGSHTWSPTGGDNLVLPDLVIDWNSILGDSMLTTHIDVIDLSMLVRVLVCLCLIGYLTQKVRPWMLLL